MKTKSQCIASTWLSSRCLAEIGVTSLLCVVGCVVLAAEEPSSDGTWVWQHPVPVGRDLTGIWGSSPDDIFIVGDRGTVVHFDGRSWSLMDSGTDDDLKAVWGTGPADVWAVGNNAVVLHYDGDGWTSSNTRSGDFFRDVWAFDADNVFVVGGSSGVHRYDGERWSRMEGTSWMSQSIWGSDPENVFAASLREVHHFDGNEWTSLEVKGRDRQGALWGFSENDVRFGSQRFDGERWTILGEPPFTSVIDVWGSDDENVFVLAERKPILHFDGSRWSYMTFEEEPLNALWGFDPDDVYAVGKRGRVLHYDGTRWQPVFEQEDLSTGSLKAVVGSGSGSVIAVGDGPLVLEHKNGTWSTMMNRKDLWNLPGMREWAQRRRDRHGSVGDLKLNGAAVSPSGRFFLVGSRGLIVQGRDDKWQVVESDTTKTLLGVWATSDSDVIAVGERGTVLVTDGPSWSSIDCPTEGDLVAVWGASAAEVFITVRGGRDASVLFWDDHALSTTKAAARRDLHAIWGTAANDVYAVGESGTIVHYDGAAWTPVSSRYRESLYGIWIDPLGTLYVCGGKGVLRRSTDGGWHRSGAGTEWTLYGIWGLETAGVFSVGSLGAILHLDRDSEREGPKTRLRGKARPGDGPESKPILDSRTLMTVLVLGACLAVVAGVLLLSGNKR